MALAQLGEGSIEVVGRPNFQDGVAEEFQSLVGGQSAMFEGVGTVCEGEIKELGVDLDLQLLEQRQECPAVVGGAGPRPSCWPSHQAWVT